VRILAIAGLMIAVGLLASVALGASLARPIQALGRAAAELGGGNLKTRISVDRQDELGLLAREFNEAARKLQELDTMKKDFVSSVTHELKSPLAAIESYLSLMLYESKDPRSVERWVRDIGTIRTHAARLSRFVTDLLDVAKIERGQFTVSRRPVAVEDLARDVVQFYGPLAKEAGVEVRLDLPSPPCPAAHADPERLRQVLVNLLSNALKFTPAGGRVTLGLRAEEGGLVGWVDDTGPGIPREALERIFEKFEQVRESRALARGPKGTGLGLAICRAIVEAHGGRIRAESEPGRGSRFVFTLPKAAGVP
jgi:signal transduction histidine kinase